MIFESSSSWLEFTVRAYVSMLEYARGNYAFSSYTDREQAPHVLWRHDVDFSINRALCLARLESERDLQATYFVGLGLPGYNPMEPRTRRLVREILSLGHRLGLHFDISGYDLGPWQKAEIEAAIAKEADWLGTLAGTAPDAVSFHNPTPELIEAFPEDEIAGLVNAYSSRLREGYLYCSDSNGYWRHRSIPEVLESGESDRLHILTHPAWWTEEPMPPRSRVERCVKGRAASVMRDYDETLAKFGRLNLSDDNNA